MPPNASRFPKRKANAKRRPAKRAVRKFGKPSKALTKAVQKIIHKDAETKSVYHSATNAFFNSGIDSAGDTVRVLPNCVAGLGDYQRIGAQIRAQTLSLKGHMLLSTSNNSVANARIAVRMMIVQPRQFSFYPDVTASNAWQATLLKKGGSGVGFTGIISDLYADINTDTIITYYDKVTYITMPYTNRVLTVGVTSVNTATETSQDMVNSCKFFNINLKVKNKLLKYDDAYSTTQPLNYAPILILGYCHLDGSSPDVLTTQVALSYVSYMKYEDM